MSDVEDVKLLVGFRLVLDKDSADELQDAMTNRIDDTCCSDDAFEEVMEKYFAELFQDFPVDVDYRICRPDNSWTNGPYQTIDIGLDMGNGPYPGNEVISAFNMMSANAFTRILKESELWPYIEVKQPSMWKRLGRDEIQ